MFNLAHIVILCTINIFFASSNIITFNNFVYKTIKLKIYSFICENQVQERYINYVLIVWSWEVRFTKH